MPWTHVKNVSSNISFLFFFTYWTIETTLLLGNIDKTLSIRLSYSVYGVDWGHEPRLRAHTLCRKLPLKQDTLGGFRQEEEGGKKNMEVENSRHWRQPPRFDLWSNVDQYSSEKCFEDSSCHKLFFILHKYYNLRIFQIFSERKPIPRSVICTNTNVVHETEKRTNARLMCLQIKYKPNWSLSSKYWIIETSKEDDRIQTKQLLSH